ncbi:MAG: DUF4159 domain-containing protein [Vicinamibacteria bacterium]
MRLRMLASLTIVGLGLISWVLSRGVWSRPDEPLSSPVGNSLLASPATEEPAISQEAFAASPSMRSIDEDEFPGAMIRSGRPREFYFSRAAYTGYGFRNFRSWSVDFPKADRQFLIGLLRLTNIDAYEAENPVQLTDPGLGRYPFLYAVEMGYMALSESEVLGLRRYLQAGGFLVIDDFWGSYEWENIVMEFQRILPGHEIVDIPYDHPIFTCFYNVERIIQVPNVGQGIAGGPTWEKDGYDPKLRGIFDEQGRLIVVINWNTDLGDAWEWAENPYYPLRFSTYAYQMGVNFIIYGMSH